MSVGLAPHAATGSNQESKKVSLRLTAPLDPRLTWSGPSSASPPSVCTEFQVFGARFGVEQWQFLTKSSIGANRPFVNPPEAESERLTRQNVPFIELFCVVHVMPGAALRVENALTRPGLWPMRPNGTSVAFKIPLVG
jgi:hypothetical protein